MKTHKMYHLLRPVDFGSVKRRFFEGRHDLDHQDRDNLHNPYGNDFNDWNDPHYTQRNYPDHPNGGSDQQGYAHRPIRAPRSLHYRSEVW